MINTGGRSPVLPVVCAAVGLGALAMAQFNTIGLGYAFGNLNNDTGVYGSLAALVLALLVWHLWPRSWVLLLGLGALCAAPTQLLLLTPESFAPSLATPCLVVTSVAKPWLLIGMLGAAIAVWRAERRGLGAALVGATLVVVPLASLMFYLISSGVAAFVPVIGLVLVVATVALAIAVAVRGPHPTSRPGWRVTAGGAVAGLAPVTYNLWRGPVAEPGSGLSGADYNRLFEQHQLVVALVVLAAGLLMGLLAGARVLVAGSAGGFVLGSLATLVGVAVVGISDAPVVVPVATVVLAVVAGMAAALSRGRQVIGVVGFAVAIVLIVVLWVGYTREDPLIDTDFAKVLTQILLAVAVIAAVALLGSVGLVLAPHNEAPAALAGVAAAVASGVHGVITYFGSVSFVPEGTTAGYAAVMVAIVCAAGLVILAHRLWARTSRPEPRPVAADRHDTSVTNSTGPYI